MIPQVLADDFVNLHDAFLNASLQRKMMVASPIETEPENFHFSDRGRFERAWACFLYVLIEAWKSDKMVPVSEWVQSVVSCDKLDSLLVRAQAEGALQKLEQVRHYMCHRDRRMYWDEGRKAVLDQIIINEELHSAFSEVLLAAFRIVNEKSSR